METKLGMAAVVLFIAICAKFIIVEGYKGVTKKELRILNYMPLYPNLKAYGKKAVFIGYAYILLGLYIIYAMIGVVADFW